MNGRIYTQEEIENIIERSFHTGVCYGSALAICKGNYEHETVIRAAMYLMNGNIRANN